MAIREATPIVLTADERTTLEGWVRSGVIEHRLVERARVVLLAAAGMASRRVAREVGCARGVVSKWRVRFARDRLAGLADARRPGKPKTYDAAIESEQLFAVNAIGTIAGIAESLLVVDAVSLLVGVNLWIYGELLAPQLEIFARDPPDPDFESIGILDTSFSSELSATVNPEVDTIIAKLFLFAAKSYQYLGAANISFNRYAAALAAGDAISAGLQLEAIIHFLSLYDAANQDAAYALDRTKDLLLEEGVAEIVFNAGAFRHLQEEIAENAFPFELTDFYADIGLTPAEIDLLRLSFVNREPSKFGRLSDSISRMAEALTGPPALPVAVDVRPRGCRNPLNTQAIGVLPVAVLGAADFDVSEINPDSVRLEGVAALGSDYDDVATPFLPYLDRSEASDCTAAGRDGFTDLKLNFRNRDIGATLHPVSPGDVLVLELTGQLYDGTPIIGQDVVIVLR